MLRGTFVRIAGKMGTERRSTGSNVQSIRTSMIMNKLYSKTCGPSF
jgi:hypothetical protein